MVTCALIPETPSSLRVSFPVTVPDAEALPASNPRTINTSRIAELKVTQNQHLQENRGRGIRNPREHPGGRILSSNLETVSFRAIVSNQSAASSKNSEE